MTWLEGVQISFSDACLHQRCLSLAEMSTISYGNFLTERLNLYTTETQREKIIIVNYYANKLMSLGANAATLEHVGFLGLLIVLKWCEVYLIYTCNKYMGSNVSSLISSSCLMKRIIWWRWRKQRSEKVSGELHVKLNDKAVFFSPMKLNGYSVVAGGCTQFSKIFNELVVR